MTTAWHITYLRSAEANNLNLHQTQRERRPVDVQQPTCSSRGTFCALGGRVAAWQVRVLVPPKDCHRWTEMAMVTVVVNIGVLWAQAGLWTTGYSLLAPTFEKHTSLH
jgi:hypothetical protein